jgi:hypothetical protein
MPTTEEPLDFGTAETTEWVPPEASPEEQIEANRYEKYSNPQDKRKAMIFDLQNDTLPDEVIEKLPLFVKTLAVQAPKLKKLEDGRFLIPTGGDNNKTKAYATKLVKFIQTGVGDALSSQSMEEVKKIIKSITYEIERKMPPIKRGSHPLRALMSMLKNGTIDEAIQHYLKINHYDVFGQEWINNTIRRGVIAQLHTFREISKAEQPMSAVAETRQLIRGILFENVAIKEQAPEIEHSFKNYAADYKTRDRNYLVKRQKELAIEMRHYSDILASVTDPWQRAQITSEMNTLLGEHKAIMSLLESN